MAIYQLGDKESRFAQFIWDQAPIASGELAALAAKELGWAKSTTYTVLKRLIDKGIFENVGGNVRTLITREEFAAGQSREFVQRNFGGSLAGFLSAFSDGEKLPEEEIRALERLIEESVKSSDDEHS